MKKSIDELISNTEITISKVIDFLDNRNFTSAERQQLISIGYLGVSDQETANAMIEDFVQIVFIDPILEIFAREAYMNMQHLSHLTFEEYKEYFRKITQSMSDVTPRVQQIFKEKIVEIFEELEWST